MAPGWPDPERWSALRDGSRCPVGRTGRARSVPTLAASWVTLPAMTPLPGYLCPVAKRHAVEPFELPMDERIAFWEDSQPRGGRPQRRVRAGGVERRLSGGARAWNRPTRPRPYRYGKGAVSLVGVVSSVDRTSTSPPTSIVRFGRITTSLWQVR